MIYISLGSNQGNRLSNLRKAVSLIKNDVLTNSYESIIIETKAILKEGSPSDWDIPYLNMVIVGETKLSPEQLLHKLKQIEHLMGRSDESGLWAPRVIDLDILLYDDLRISTHNLTIPHGQLLKRDFFIHLLAMMPKKYVPQLQIRNQGVSADEYAHKEYASKIIDSGEVFLKSFALSSQIVGILNITPDSFSDGGNNLNPENAAISAYQMVQDGAEIIDIGAQSTRPGASIIGVDAEYKRLSPVIDRLSGINAQISIDSYHPDLIRKILANYKIDWINDVTGKLDQDILKEIAQAGCKIVSMHSLSVPPRRDLILSHDSDCVVDLEKWSYEIYEKMLNCGFDAGDIIIDPGIGFGKSQYQNLSIIRNIESLKKIGVKILVGHSRKSFMKGFFEGQMLDRDLETINISSILEKSSIDYIRVHNVRDHQRMSVVNKLIS